MKKTFYLSLLALALFSCNPKETKTTENKDENNITEKPSTQNTDTKQASNQLVIEGKDIWVRNKPSTGDVIMKLNDGDKCEIIEKGKKEQIRDMVDYWYKISFNQKEGWVYGAQTNLKTEEKPVLQDFSKFLAEFVRDGKAKKDMKSFINTRIGVYVGNNPGVMCTSSNTKNPKVEFGDTFTPNNIFNRAPKGDFCEGYSGEKNGFYYVEINKDGLPKFGSFDENGDVETTTIDIPKDINVDKFIKVTMVADEYHHACLYFASIDFQWYLICQDFCDCSA